MDRETKNRESRLRYALKKQGYYLVKSRVRTWHEYDFGEYMIVDNRNICIAGDRFDLSLDDVEKFVKE